MFDYYGKKADELKRKKLWLLDMDGTIYKENQLFDGTLDLLRQIEEDGGKYVFITNNSSKSVIDYISKVNYLGIRADLDNFFTSAQAAALYLEANYPGAKVYCQGTRSLIGELSDVGIDITENVEKVDVVLIGFDMELTAEKLRNTCEILSTQDVVYLATNPDLVCPVTFGFIPDCGSICCIIKNATGKEPKYIGKPQAIMVDFAREKFGVCPEDTVVVGDRLYTDIATGLNAGVTTVCVLTGEATVENIVKGEIKPTYTFNSVKDIYETITEQGLKQVLDRRSSQIANDIVKCKNIIAANDEEGAKIFVRYLNDAYGFADLVGDNYIAKIKEGIRHLMWAIRML